jgi:hypothetical protein
MKTTEVIEQANKTNSLIYKVSRTKGKKHVIVNIRLNDECNNGHQDFAITGTVYEADKPYADKYMISTGCCHEHILKAFPEFKIFVDLHLCDFNGTPMCPVANGFYHIKNGFNDAKPGDHNFMSVFCEHYRISPKEFKKLATASDQTHYGIILNSLLIRERWKQEAKEAIKILEGLTSNVFVNDSKRSQWDGPTPKEIKLFNEREKTGYYTPDAIKKRDEEKARAVLTEKINSLNAEIEKVKRENEREIIIAKAIYEAGGVRALENYIYYSHGDEICFNWRSYDKLTIPEVDKIKSKLKLPKGAKLTVK